MPGRKPKYDDATFIRAWKACESQAQLAKRLGVQEAHVTRRAKAIRAKGIVLPPQRVTP